MPHRVETLAYTGNAPWHGLGILRSPHDLDGTPPHPPGNCSVRPRNPAEPHWETCRHGGKGLLHLEKVSLTMLSRFWEGDFSDIDELHSICY